MGPSVRRGQKDPKNSDCAQYDDEGCRKGSELSSERHGSGGANVYITFEGENDTVTVALA